MSIVKCPNPSCPYTFDASSVPPGAVLACPRCGMQFTMGPMAPPAMPPGMMPHPGMHHAPQPPMPPAAQPSGTGLNFNAAAAPPGGAPSTSKARAIARNPLNETPKKQSYQMILIIGIALILVIGAVVTIIAKMSTPTRSRDEMNTIKGLNLSFPTPTQPWEKNEDARAELGAGITVVFTRADPEAFIAIGGQDFTDRMPRQSELEQALSRVVQKNFENDNIEKDHTDAKWLGLPAAKAYRFRGQNRNTGENVQGEAIAVADRGIGYWCIAWAPETKIDEMLPQFEAIRESFRLADPKRVWQPKRSTISSIRGDKLAYSMQDPDDMWKEDRTLPPGDENALADLKRVARVKGPRGSDVKFEAMLVTYIIESSGEPMDDAKTYLEQALNTNSAIEGKTILSPVSEEPAGSPSPNAVAKNTQVVRLKAVNGSIAKLIVLAAIKVEGKVVFVRCMCPWDEREVFEQNFLATAGSLQPGR